MQKYGVDLSRSKNRNSPPLLAKLGRKTPLRDGIRAHCIYGPTAQAAGLLRGLKILSSDARRLGFVGKNKLNISRFTPSNDIWEAQETRWNRTIGQILKIFAIRPFPLIQHYFSPIIKNTPPFKY